MKNTMRKFSTVLLALAMIFAMSISTFAAAGSGSDLGGDTSINPDKSGVVSNAGTREDGRDSGEKDSQNKATHGTFNGVGATVTLDKEIVIFNTRGTGNDTLVYLPNIKYEYEVKTVSVTSGKYITDEYGNKGAILSTSSSDTQSAEYAAGQAKPSGKSNVEFSNTNGITGTGMTAITTPYVITTTAGKEARGTFDLTFDESKFKKPGVYRYVIEETVASGFSRDSAGIVNDTYHKDRYIDVYVQNAPTGSTNPYEIYGFVVFEDDSNKQDTEFTANPGTAITSKTNGYVSDKYDDGETAYDPGEKGVDIYQTTNVQIKKVITGTMADKNNEFPFAAVLNNTVITKDPKVSFQVVNDDAPALDTTATTNPAKVMTGGTATIGSASATAADGLKLDNDDYVYIYGIPSKNSTNTVTKLTTATGEYNNTPDVYTVTAEYDNAGVAVTNASMAAAATSLLSEAKDVPVDTKAQHDLVVTNKLNAISPTNVVMRFAPYLFILAAGMMLLMVSRRRKAEQE